MTSPDEVNPCCGRLQIGAALRHVSSLRVAMNAHSVNDDLRVHIRPPSLSPAVREEVASLKSADATLIKWVSLQKMRS